MKKWTEGYVHIGMRNVLKQSGFQLIAGEYPGGSDHELYPLNVVDPSIARDSSPDPRRHSAGELIPDIVALRGRDLVIGEAKVDYNEADRQKLETLLTDRRGDLILALAKFSREKGFPELLPVDALNFIPTLIFTNLKMCPAPHTGMSYIILQDGGSPKFLGPILEVVSK